MTGSADFFTNTNSPSQILPHSLSATHRLEKVGPYPDSSNSPAVFHSSVKLCARHGLVQDN
jgi:hypothetical protein